MGLLLKRIAILKNSIQEYSWGSKTFIPQLMGEPSPSERPQAELWMGAHPKAPSNVFSDGEWRSLPELIANNPEDIFGPAIARKFSNKLPFLFKILASARPLSIQAHPSKEEAREGFARENMEKIPLDALQRNYKDENHKPEIICALKSLSALKGFRKVEDIVRVMDDIGAPSQKLGLDILRNQPDQEGLQGFFHALMKMDRERQRRVVNEVVACIERYSKTDQTSEWVIRLNNEYPGDIGVLFPILLNVVQLNPGEAIHIPAGELHSYLEGVGLELMASSDNVLRGGLTPKYVDVPELLKILDFQYHEVEILRPEKQKTGEHLYPKVSDEFILSVISLNEGSFYESPQRRCVEIMICMEGDAHITDLGSGEILELSQGTSIIIPAAVKQYRLEGVSTVYKAAVPLY